MSAGENYQTFIVTTPREDRLVRHEVVVSDDNVVEVTLIDTPVIEVERVVGVEPRSLP